VRTQGQEVDQILGVSLVARVHAFELHCSNPVLGSHLTVELFQLRRNCAKSGTPLISKDRANLVAHRLDLLTSACPRFGSTM
jgi:hypothetical protein